MSYTFFPSRTDNDIKARRIYCCETEYGEPGEGHGSREFPTYEEAAQAYAAGLEDGTIDRHCCGIDIVWSCDFEEFEVNVSQSNGDALLDMLGFRDENGELPYSGLAAPDDLIGRIAVARALCSDEGIPSVESVGARGARLIDMGRRPGYFAEKLLRLEHLALTCKNAGRAVSWG